MTTVSKWLRQIHRWLVVPFVFAIILMIIGSVSQGETFELPLWLSLVLIGSLFCFILTGIYMFVQPYWARWQRYRRNRHEPVTK